MAKQLGIFDQWFRGEWADRTAINQNAEELNIVEGNLMNMVAELRRQAQEILRLRAMFMGVVEVLHDKAPFDDAELERAVQTAWAKLTMPPPPPPPRQPAAMTDPYRGIPLAPVDTRTTTCIKCRRQVPATRTNITADGEVCDACI